MLRPIALRAAASVSVAALIYVAELFGFLDPRVARIGYGLVIVLGGAWVVSAMGDVVYRSLEPRIGNRALSISNAAKLMGYILVGVVGLSYIGISPEAALAGGAFTGLVIGLAAQPVLGNIFAGIYILATRFVEVGDEVRIITWELPYQWAFLPAYKFFSPDYVYVGYRGRVVEVNLFYTTIVTESGTEIKYPNMVVLRSAVIDYSPRWAKSRVVNVRVEYPLDAACIDDLVEMVKEALKGFDVVDGPYLNEQSENNRVIVLVRIRVPNGENWRRVKSEALRSLLSLWQRLKTEQRNLDCPATSWQGSTAQAGHQLAGLEAQSSISGEPMQGRRPR